MLTLIEHDVDAPALFGAAAAAHVARAGGTLMHLPARFDTARHPDAVQHPLAAGGLEPSGLIWFERLTSQTAGRAASPDEIVAAARDLDVAVPIHPAFGASGELVASLMAKAAGHGVAVQHVVVVDDGAVLLVRGGRRPLAWRDAFGRIVLDEPPRSSGSPCITIGLVGSEHDQRHVYPANLAALADAADALAMSLAIAFLDPSDLHGPQDCEPLLRMAGIVLPGGAAMANVAGQIVAATASFAAGVPTLGLCLGMQTMTTALVQKAIGRDANLAEADPRAPVKTFVPIGGPADAPSFHRLGDQPLAVQAGTRLSDILAGRGTVRCNHRFRLDEKLLPMLETMGLRVGARGLDDTVIDAIEVSGHAFYMGMQGHPELGSRAGTPHPLLRAFLATAAAGITARALA